MSAPATPDYDLDEEFATKRSPIQRIQMTLHRYPWLSSLIVLIVVIVIFGLVNERFLLPSTISLMIQQTVIVGTLAIAQTLIILDGGHRPVDRRDHDLRSDADGEPRRVHNGLQCAADCGTEPDASRSSWAS